MCFPVMTIATEFSSIHKRSYYANKHEVEPKMALADGIC